MKETDYDIIARLKYQFEKEHGTLPNSIIVPIGYESHLVYHGLTVLGYTEKNEFIVCLA